MFVSQSVANFSGAIFISIRNNIASHAEGKVRADWDNDVSDYVAQKLFEKARNALGAIPINLG